MYIPWWVLILLFILAALVAARIASLRNEMERLRRILRHYEGANPYDGNGETPSNEYGERDAGGDG